MLVFDELKKNDFQLRLVAITLAAGLFILLAGLWWVQIVSAHEFQNHLQTQSFRTVRVPALRGKILDREGRVLAENRPRYDLNLYLDELRQPFDAAFGELRKAALTAQKQNIAAAEKKLGRSLNKTERKNFAISPDQTQAMREQARDRIVAGIIAQVGEKLGQPVVFNVKDFNSHYARALAMPYTILPKLNPEQIARFEENFPGNAGANLELQSVRNYPFNTSAAHVLGYLVHDNDSVDGEEPFYNYRLPDFRGAVGIEGGFNAELRGHAGGQSVLVNNLGYRQSEIIGNEPAAGNNVTLTIDLDIQRAAEKSILTRQGAAAHAAVVVMDVRSGDVLGMVSSPAFDPNDFAQGISHEKYAQLQELTAEKNRATYENYAPGSIFKTVVALAALENGLNVNEIYHVEANPTKPGKGCIYVGKRKIEDTAAPGDYDFKRAFIHSSNSYFINYGLTKAGVENVIRIGEEFHLGERTGILPRQETPGNFPTDKEIHSGWRDGDTANLCIGQGAIDVTPIQMAVMAAAIANGGIVLWPRLVQKIEPQNFSSSEGATNFPAGRVRDRLSVHPRSLKILRDAMLADVESSEGTGTPAAVAGIHIGAKTGTAQVQDEHNHLIGHNYWFASFAPFENPKYAVVVMVQSATESGSGGATCAPIAHDIYETILKKENLLAAKGLAAN